MKKRILFVVVLFLLLVTQVSAGGWQEMVPRHYNIYYGGDFAWLMFYGDYWTGPKRCYVCVRGLSETGYPVTVRADFGGLIKYITVNGPSGVCTPYNISGNPYTYQGAVSMTIVRQAGTAALKFPLVMAWEYGG